MAPPKQTAPFQTKVLVHLDQDVADALVCYLDEEDVFPNVIDALLKALPLPEPEIVTTQERPKLDIEQIYEDLWVVPYQVLDLPKYGFLNKGKTLKAFLDDNQHIRSMRDTVFQIAAVEGVVYVMGWNSYEGKNEGRHWWDNNGPLDPILYPSEYNLECEVIGYYHVYSNTLRRSNDGVIAYLIANEYISA